MKCEYSRCTNEVQSVGRGRPPRFCSDLCRKRGQRERDVTKINSEHVTKREDIRLYCGINENNWNHHPVSTGEYACIAPVYGKTKETKTVNNVAVPHEAKVIMDSGAFSDTTDQRLSFEQALHRQVAHAYRFGYVKQISHVASYDLLIDEKWQDGERSKIRWSKDEAESAVKETILAAAYAARQRRVIHGMFGRKVGLILSAQGVEVEQYLRCAQGIVPMLEEEDVFGLGGWCITGLLPDAIMPSFRAIMQEVIPYLGSVGVKRAHIWGVCFTEALGELLWLCDQHGIKLSTDSSGPQRRPVLPSWGYGSWRQANYKMPSILDSCKVKDEYGNRVPTCAPDAKCRGLERIRHVALTRDWLNNFRDREPAAYRFVPIVKPAYKQASWLEAV